jgi:orotate phosphoribosyltransferase
MLLDESVAKEFSAKLIQIGAIQLRPEAPFTWASGWHSPIYCDNRLTLSYPAIRSFIATQLAALCRKHYPETTCIAGVATAGIAHGLLLAEALSLPFIYVRADAKQHGRQNKIEGQLKADDKVLVIEDLISTGGSSLKAVEAVREQGIEVVGLLALFTYGFTQADKAFEQAQCAYHTLTNYSTTITYAIEQGILQADQQTVLEQWRQHPETWGK